MKQKPEFELAKRLPGPSQMERVRAARAILNASGPIGGSECSALRAFMDIFHPEVSQDRVRNIVADLRSQGKC